MASWWDAREHGGCNEAVRRGGARYRRGRADGRAGGSQPRRVGRTVREGRGRVPRGVTEHSSTRSGADPAGLRHDGQTTRWLAPVLLAMAASGVSQGFVRFTYPFVLPAMRQDVLG